MSYAETHPPRRTGGFSLVELMVALLISGILVTAIFQMMTGQSRMVAVQGAREEVQQNVRGALEVISADLRGVFPSGILEANAQSITFMQPRAWGIVCGGAGNSVDAIFPTTGGALPDNSAASGIVVNNSAAGPAFAPTWYPAPPARAAVTSVQQLPGVGGTPCANLGADGAFAVLRITTNDAGLGAQAVLGNQIAAYHLTRYDLAQQDGRWWIRRSMGILNGDYNMQPLAGPAVPEHVGFSYFQNGGDVAMAVPGTDAAQLAQVRMVSVRAGTTSSQSVNGHAQIDSGTVRVLLRNSP